MNYRVPPDQYPWWVKFALLGAKSRASQWFWVIASLVAGIALVLLAVTDTGPMRIWLALAGVWGFIAAALYYGTIRWMDRHGTWG